MSAAVGAQNCSCIIGEARRPSAEAGEAYPGTCCFIGDPKASFIQPVPAEPRNSLIPAASWAVFQAQVRKLCRSK